VHMRTRTWVGRVCVCVCGFAFPTHRPCEADCLPVTLSLGHVLLSSTLASALTVSSVFPSLSFVTSIERARLSTLILDHSHQSQTARPACHPQRL